MQAVSDDGWKVSKQSGSRAVMQGYRMHGGVMFPW
jgi:hypothetical protein